MRLRSILNLVGALAALVLSAATSHAQEAPAKRLANVVGVAVDEYGKGVDALGRITLQLEYDEAVAFLGDARAIADRVPDARKVALGALVDSMRLAVNARVAPVELNAIHARLVTLLGPDAALDYPTRPVDLDVGRTIYAARCASCHGDDGDGKGFAAVGMTPPPPAFANAELMADVTPALMYRIVSVGIQGTAMTGFADLSSDERWAVVTYISTLRAAEGEAARGREILAARCENCDGAPPPGHTFGWLAERHDQQVLAALSVADAALGLDADAPLTPADAKAVVAALRAQPAVVAPPTRTAAVVAADVLRVLDEAIAKSRAGDAASASDLAFDAYVTFEPLESTVRTRDPGMVALLERQFADFKGAVQGGNADAASSVRERIAVGLPQVVALSEREPSRWGAFFESLLIIIREGFEAILIIGAVIAFLMRTGNATRVREVKWGAGIGLVASAVLAVVLRTLLVNAPASREVIEGATMLVAVGVLFSVSYWLLTKVETAHWQKFIRDKVGAALTSQNATALAVVAFLAVFREGAETALFYQALFLRGSQAILPVTLGFVVGAVLLTFVWIAFHRFGKKLPLRGFFTSTSALLYALAFVFLGKGIRELQEGNVFSITPLTGGPYFEPLGIFPSVETLAAQAVLVALALFAAWRTFGGSAAPAAKAAVTAPAPAAAPAVAPSPAPAPELAPTES